MRRGEHRSEAGPKQWMSGGGVMGELIRSKAWVATPLGAIEQWPPSLRTALGICLAFPMPACIAWGRGRVQLYNDLYSQLPVHRRFGALGQDFADSWPEDWAELEAAFDRAAGGEPSLATTFSFVPIRDEGGGVGGLFITLVDAAAAVLRSQLERANADVEQYSYAISHDFRAPLRTLEQMSRIVIADHAARLSADAVKLLNHVVRGAGTLADRADALSRVAQLGEQALVRRRVDVVALVNGIIAQLRGAVTGRQVEMVVGDLPAVDADPEFLRLVITSLLTNACKFTRDVAHARIEVRGRREARQNVYSISDNGAGFDMKYAGKLYGFFQRLHTEAQFEGIGIELALARRLIERHGGTIWAQAQKDCGATFHFTLPA